MDGTLIAGKYRIGRRIGSGGMGAVFEATNEFTHRRVALKVLTKDIVGERDGSSSDLSASIQARYDEVGKRFAREAQASGTINSENVVQVLDAGTDSVTGRAYMVMEFLEGNNLQWLSKKLGALEPDGALRVVAQACNGLVAAHEAGVTHRDVKLANLFLAESPDAIRVKVLDFGIAKIAFDEMQESHETQLTQTGSMLGSPHYMSPEQAKGLKSIDHRTDIWSMGVVMYRLFAGQHPIDAPSFGQLLLAICSSDVPHIQDVAPWVSPEVAAIVHRALRREPSERFSTTREMLVEIDKLLPLGRELSSEQIHPIREEEKNRIAPRYVLPFSEAASAPSAGAASATAGAANRGAHFDDLDTSLEFRTAPRKSGGAGWRGVVALLGFATVGGVAATLVLSRTESESAEPSSAVVATTGVEQAIVVAVNVEPAAVEVLLGGKPVQTSDGRFELAGAPGSVHAVQLRKDGETESFEVVITAQGAKPNRLSFETADGDAAPAVDGSAKPTTGEPSDAARPAVAVSPPPVVKTPTSPPVRQAPPPPKPPPGDRLGGTDAFD